MLEIARLTRRPVDAERDRAAGGRWAKPKRAHRGGSVKPLGNLPGRALRLEAGLEVALGQVDAGPAGNDLAAFAQRENQFHLMMQILGLAGIGQGGRCRDGTGRLGKEDRFGGFAHLLGMVGIIAADTEDATDGEMAAVAIKGETGRGGAGDKIAHALSIAEEGLRRRANKRLAAAAGIRQVWGMTDPTPPALSLRDYLPYRLAVTSNQVSRLVARAYQDRFGLTIWEWRVIALLGEAEPMTAQSLSDIAAMDKVSVSRAVKALVERGLVMRAERVADRRSRDLHLTEAGRQTYAEITPVALTAEADLLTGLDETQIAELARLLDLLRSRAGELAERQAGN